MAKRLNTKFLVVSAATLVVGGGAAAVGAKYFLSRKNPQQFIHRADELVAKGDLKGAAKEYQTAFRIDNTNKDVLLKFGDTLNALSGEDLENLAKARQAWSLAVQIDPRFAPALQRLLDSYWDELEIRPAVDLSRNVQDIAGRLAATDTATPEQRHKARARMFIAQIRQAERGAPVTPADMDKAIAGLTELAKEQPAEADLPFYIGRAKFARAIELRSSPITKDKQDSDRLVSEIDQLFDNAVKGQEQNAAMQLRAFQVYSLLAQLAGRINATQPAGGATRPANDFVVKADAALAAARKAVKPEDSHYTDIQLAATESLRRSNKTAEADAIYQDLLKNRPGEQRIRLSYAAMYESNPAKRQELIDLLSKPIGDGKLPQGVDAMGTKFLQAETVSQLTTLQIAAFQATTDKATRESLLKQVRDNVQKIEDLKILRAEHPLLLQKHGELSLLEGNLVDAIEAFEKALRGLSRNETSFYDLEYRLAGLYGQTGQTGQAKKNLNDIITRYPGYVPARLLMAQMYLKENDVDAADGQLQALKKIKADAPEVQRLEISVLEQKKAGSATALIDKLPETTRDEKMRKAQYLLGVNRNEDAVKMLEKIIAADPKDIGAVNALIQVHVVADNRETALSVAQSALAANPDHAGLKRAVEVLQKEMPREAKESYEFQKELVLREADSVDRELKLYDLELQFGNVEEADKHLQAAQAKAPDKVDVWIRQFGQALRRGKFTDADTVVAKLSQANADDVNGFFYKFKLEMARERFPEAEAAAREMIKRRPTFAQGYVSLGQVLQAKNDYRPAVEAYQSALDKQPANREALRGLIDCHTLLTERESARNDIERARKLFPRDTMFRELEMSYELTYGDNPEKVVQQREKQFKDNPKEPVNALALASALVRTANQKYAGKVNEKKANDLRAQARDVLLEAFKTSPNDARVVGSLVEVFQSLNDNASAKKVLDQFAAKEEQKDKSATNLLYAEFYDRAKQPDQAEAQLRAALEKSGSADTRQRLVKYLAAQKKFDEAIAALGAEKGDPRLAAQRIELLIAAKKLDDAEKAIRTEMAKIPDAERKNSADYLRLMNLLSAKYIEAQQYQQAVDNATQTLAIASQDEAAMYYRGLARLNVQPPEPGRAADDLAIVADRNPRSLKVLLALAEANKKSGDTGAAIVQQRKALDIEPLNKEVRARLIDWYAEVGRASDVMQLVNEALSKPQLADEWAWDRAAAMVNAARGEYADALKRIDAAMKLARPQDKPSLYNDQLTILYRAKNYPEMTRVSQKLLDQGMNYWWIHLARAMAFNEDKNAAGVVKELDQAFAAVDPTTAPGDAETLARTVAKSISPAEAQRRIEPWLKQDWNWRLLSAEFAQNRGDWAGAAQTIEQVMGDIEKTATPAQLAVAYRRVAAAYIAMQPTPQLDKAVETYQKLVKIAPTDIYSLNNLAFLLSEKVNPPRPKDAKEYSQRAYDLVRKQGKVIGRDNLMILDTHGWVLVLCGGKEIDQGIRVLNEAIAVEQFPDAYYHLAEAYLRKNDGPEAQRQLQTASNLIDRAKQAKQPVDAELEARVKSAADRVKQMTRAG